MVNTLRNNLLLMSFACLLCAAIPDAATEETSTEANVEGDAQSEVPVMEKEERKEPGYDLSEDARSPFRPVLSYAQSQPSDNDVTEDEERQELTDALVRDLVTLDAVVSSGKDTIAIINRSVLRRGESLTIEQGGRVYTLRVEKLKRNPPLAILVYEDRRFSITAGK